MKKYKHYLFSKAAFALLSTRLTFFNDVLNALDDAEGNRKIRVHGGIGAKVISSHQEVEYLLKALRDQVEKNWYFGNKLTGKAPLGIVDDRIDGKPLLDLYSRYERWQKYRRSVSVELGENEISAKSIQRAFPHLLRSDSTWSRELLTILPKPFGISDRRGYASLLSFLIWDCEIEAAMKLPEPDRFLIEFESQEESTPDGRESSVNGKESGASEKLAETNGPTMNPWWALRIGGITVSGAAAIMILVWLAGGFRYSHSVNNVRDIAIKGSNNHLEQNNANVIVKIERLYSGGNKLGKLPQGLPIKLPKSAGNAVASNPSRTNSVPDSQVDVLPMTPKDKGNEMIEFSGTLFDGKSYASVSGARVRLTTGETAESDAQGNFRFTVPAKYAIRSQQFIIEKEGYVTCNQEFTLGKNAEYPIVLYPN